MKNKFSDKIFDFLAIFLALTCFIVLFLNIDYLKVPHGDIYQYISDAKHYARFEFPWLIQLQPLTPILIAVFVPFFSEFEFPYFAAAKFINIVAAGGTFIFTYLIAKKHLNSKIALIISLLCSIHPLTIAVSLDITTVGLYAFFAIAALYFIKANTKIFFLMTTLAFLVRIEGFILIIVYIISKINLKKIKEKFLEKKYKSILFALFKENINAIVFLFLATVWTVFQSIHNLSYYNIPYGNQYLNEMSSISLRVEDFVYLYGLIGALFFPRAFVWWGIDLLNPGLIMGTLIIISLFFLVKIILTKKTREYGLYILLLALVHSFFPAIEYRYFFLFLNLFVIGIVVVCADIYLQIKHFFLKVLMMAISLITIAFWLTNSIDQLKNMLTDYRPAELDLYYETSQWLFNSMENGEYYVIAEKEYIYLKIFLNSKKYLKSISTDNAIMVYEDDKLTKVAIGEKIINFIKLGKIKENCQNIKCLFEKIDPSEGARHILITHQWSEVQAKDFWWNYNGVFLIEELLQNKSCLEEKASFEYFENYRKVNFFNKDCYLTQK